MILWHLELLSQMTPDCKLSHPHDRDCCDKGVQTLFIKLCWQGEKLCWQSRFSRLARYCRNRMSTTALHWHHHAKPNLFKGDVWGSTTQYLDYSRPFIPLHSVPFNKGLLWTIPTHPLPANIKWTFPKQIRIYLWKPLGPVALTRM